MKAVIQRVTRASVTVLAHPGGAVLPTPELVSEIGLGLVTLLGVGAADTAADVEWLIRKVVSLRIFEDDAGKMNRSLIDVGGKHLIVSQFTLYADAQKGNRPSFIEAARPEIANPLYERALVLSRELGVETLGGKFQATMRVSIENDGPVTIVLESKKDEPRSRD